MKSVLAILAATLSLASALTARSLSPDADVNVIANFGEDHAAALTGLFAAIEAIPDEVLLAGDVATEQWLVDAGIAAPEVLGHITVDRKRDEAAAAEVSETVAAPVEEAFTWTRRAVAPAVSIWKIAKCVAAIVQLLATTAVPAAKLLKIKKLIEALGGTKKAVELMLKATSKAEKLKAGGEALVALAAEVSGISSVKKNCF